MFVQFWCGIGFVAEDVLSPPSGRTCSNEMLSTRATQPSCLFADTRICVFRCASELMLLALLTIPIHATSSALFYPKSFHRPLLYNVLRCCKSPISKIREVSVRHTIAEHSALIHCVRPQHIRRERRTMEIPDTGCTAALAPKLGDWCADTPVGQVPVVYREDSGSQLRLSDVRAMASDLAA